MFKKSNISKKGDVRENRTSQANGYGKPRNGTVEMFKKPNISGGRNRGDRETAGWSPAGGGSAGSGMRTLGKAGTGNRRSAQSISVKERQSVHLSGSRPETKDTDTIGRGNAKMGKENTMEKFNPITTQEQLDAIITARVQRERETVTGRFQEQLNGLQEKITGYEGQIQELQGKISGYEGQIQEKDQKISGFDNKIAELNKQLKEGQENADRIKQLETQVQAYETSSAKMRIARETGLPYELAERLTGDTEEAMRTDAEGLKKLIGRQNVPPLANPETAGMQGGEKDAVLKNLLQKVRNR